MIDDLIARLERARVPSKALDDEIARLIGFYREHFMKRRQSDRFTGNLDAALTLIPSGYWWDVRRRKMAQGKDHPLPNGHLYECNIGPDDAGYLRRASKGVGVMAATAVCVAALNVKDKA